MKIHDISMLISETMLYWPNTPIPEQGFIAKISEGDGGNHSYWSIGCHNGTHIDASNHLLDEGDKIDVLDLYKLVGDVFVQDLSGLESDIKAEDIRFPRGTQRILFKTNNSRKLDKPFTEDYVGLSVSGAEYIINNGIKLVGIDYLGIEPFNQIPESPTHIKLLSNDVNIIEGINLGNIDEGTYTLCCLPLLLDNSEAAPARAILIEDL